MISIDVTPSVRRIRTRSSDILATIVPNSKILVKVAKNSFRILTGMERMMVTGFPLNILEGALTYPSISDGLYKDLVGNAFTCSITLAIFIAIMTNVTEKQKHILHKKACIKRRRIEPKLGAQDIQDMVGSW